MVVIPGSKPIGDLVSFKYHCNAMAIEFEKKQQFIQFKNEITGMLPVNYNALCFAWNLGTIMAQCKFKVVIPTCDCEL